MLVLYFTALKKKELLFLCFIIIEALEFFRDLFHNNDLCHPYSLQLGINHHTDPELQSVLVSPFTNEEVNDALFSMQSYKAPGLDGFQPIFFKTYWHIVGHDVWQQMAAFQSGNIIPNLAETLIVPIPKINVPLHFKDFRPISLCNGLLKVISKVLVRRIRPYLDSFIGPFQSSFTPKRGTSDNALIAQEIVHTMHKK